MTFWNWYCYKCKWKGVAQELEQDYNTEQWWVCPQCNSTEIEDMGWHEEKDEKYDVLDAFISLALISHLLVAAPNTLPFAVGSMLLTTLATTFATSADA